MRSLLLIDNGSKRPDSTLELRRLAEALSRRVGEPVRPVSLLHADQVPSALLDARPADTFAPTLRRLLSLGNRDLVLLPLFFGPSRALTQFVPETAASLAAELGAFRLRIAPPLCPLPDGESRLVDILHDNIRQTTDGLAIAPRRVILVDHGTPLPEVTAVRRWLGERLGERLGPGVLLDQAVMERRPGAEFDFNGPLLEELLEDLARADVATPVILSMLFLSAGRHAGAGGDISGICARVEDAFPGFRVYPSPLVGSHPALLDILAERLSEQGRWISPAFG